MKSHSVPIWAFLGAGTDDFVTQFASLSGCRMGVTVTNTAVCVMCKRVRIANVKQAGHQRGVKGSAYQRADGNR